MRTTFITIAGIVFLGFLVFNLQHLKFVEQVLTSTFGSSSGLNRSACANVSNTVASVGNQLSSTILSARSTRSWATIENVTQASSSVALSFGGTAVFGSGFTLNNSSTSTMNEITFGLDTSRPYTGAVTGITNIGSTTVLVTECYY